MLDPTGRVFRRIRKERGDKLTYVAALIGVGTSEVSNVECNYRDVPGRWLSRLPEAYLLPVAGALIERHLREIREVGGIVSEKMKPRLKGPIGASGTGKLPCRLVE